MRKVIIAVICFVLVIAIGLVAFMVVGINGGLSWNNPFNFADNLQLANRQEFSAADFSRLEVHYGSDRITLVPSGGSTVVIEEYMTNWDDSKLANISKNGGTLRVENGNRPIAIGFNVWAARIYVHVPKSWDAEVVLENTSGSIHTEGSGSFKAFTATNGSGSINVADITATGDIYLENRSGSIKADTLQAGGSVTAANGSGSVKPVRITAGGDITLSGKSGSINTEQLEAGGAVSLTNGSGSIKPGVVQTASISVSGNSGSIGFTRAVAGTITATNGSGSIHFDYLEGAFDLTGNSGSLLIEGGRGHGRASTGSGSLKVTLGEVTGDLDLESRSGSNKLHIPSSTAFSFYGKTGSGSLRIPDELNGGYNQRGNEVNATYGSSPTIKIFMRSGSGSTRLEWN